MIHNLRKRIEKNKNYSNRLQEKRKRKPNESLDKSHLVQMVNPRHRHKLQLLMSHLKGVRAVLVNLNCLQYKWHIQIKILVRVLGTLNLQIEIRTQLIVRIQLSPRALKMEKILRLIGQ